MFTHFTLVKHVLHVLPRLFAYHDDAPKPIPICCCTGGAQARLRSQNPLREMSLSPRGQDHDTDVSEALTACVSFCTLIMRLARRRVDIVSSKCWDSPQMHASRRVLQFPPRESWGARRRDHRQAGRVRRRFQRSRIRPLIQRRQKHSEPKESEDTLEYDRCALMNYLFPPCAVSQLLYNEFEYRFSSPWLRSRDLDTSVFQPLPERLGVLVRETLCVCCSQMGGTAAALMPTLRTLVSLLCRYGTCPAFLLLRATTHCSR